MTYEQAKSAMNRKAKVCAERDDMVGIGYIVEVDGDEALVRHADGTDSFYLDEIEEV